MSLPIAIATAPAKVFGARLVDRYPIATALLSRVASSVSVGQYGRGLRKISTEEHDADRDPDGKHASLPIETELRYRLPKLLSHRQGILARAVEQQCTELVATEPR